MIRQYFTIRDTVTKEEFEDSATFDSYSPIERKRQIEDIVASWNKTLRPFDNPRELVKIGRYEMVQESEHVDEPEDIEWEEEE